MSRMRLKLLFLACAVLVCYTLQARAQDVPDAGSGTCAAESSDGEKTWHDCSSGSSSGGSTDGGLIGALIRSIFSPPSRTASPAEIARNQRLTEAYRLNEAGIKAYNAGDWATAVARFSEALQQSPNDQTIQGNLDAAKEKLNNQQALGKMRANLDSLTSQLASSESASNIFDSATPATSAPAIDFMSENTRLQPTPSTLDPCSAPGTADSSVVDLRCAKSDVVRPDVVKGETAATPVIQPDKKAIDFLVETEVGSDSRSAWPGPKNPDVPLKNPLLPEHEANLQAGARLQLAEAESGSADPLTTVRLRQTTLSEISDAVGARYQSDPAFRKSIDNQIGQALAAIRVQREHDAAVAEAHRFANLRTAMDKLQAQGLLKPQVPLPEQEKSNPAVHAAMEQARSAARREEEQELKIDSDRATQKLVGVYQKIAADNRLGSELWQKQQTK